MKSTLIRRLSAAIIVPTLTFGTLAATSQSAQAAPNSYAYSAARWLADQIDVTLGAPYFEGTALDIFWALNDLDTRPGDQARVLAGLASTAHTDSYLGELPAVVSGATAKLTAAVQAGGGDTSDFGDDHIDLISKLESTVVATGDEAGRGKNIAGFGDFSSTFTQVWVVRALANDENPLAVDATDYLLNQQCADGSFRSSMYNAGAPDDPETGWDDSVPVVDLTCGDTTTSGDDDPSVDATGFALRALLVADEAGVTGLDDDIADGIAWLKEQQEDNGSFGDSANLTGLAAVVLKATGATGHAGAAAKWLVQHQVSDTVAEGTALEGEIGGVALDDAGLANGKADGIVPELEFANVRGEWISATSQAAYGLNALLPTATLSVSATGSYVAGNANTNVSVTGLAPGERVTATIDGAAATATGRADADGAATLSVKMPAATKNYSVKLTGSRDARNGSATVKVLGAKTLAPKLKYTSVRRYGTQTVSITGLAPNEVVRVGYRNKVIKTSAATGSGTFSYSFKVGADKGTKTVSLRGQFTNRYGTKTFRVS